MVGAIPFFCGGCPECGNGWGFL